MDPPVTVLEGQCEGRPGDGSHVHHAPVDGGGAQLFPDSLATGTPQTFPDGLPTDDLGRLRSRRPITPGPACTAAQPISARLELVQCLPGVPPLVHSSLHLPVLLARPEPSGSASPSRRCRGCFPPFPAPPGSGCRQLHPGCCDSPKVGPFTPPGCTAPHGAPGHPCSWSTAG